MTRRFAWAAALVALVGCQTLDPWGHRRNLEDAQRSYTQMVRWGDFERASEWVDPEERGRFLADAERLAEVRVTDYEIGSLDLDDEGGAATVRVSYRAYHLATLVEREVLEVQSWYFDGDTGRWQVRPTLTGLRDTILDSRER